MRFAGCLLCAVLMPLGGLMAGLHAQEPVAAEASLAANQPSTGTYPQIVRVSLAEGDVRIARGKRTEKLTGAEWEKVTGDLPLESGYKLVTGEGRAEIEFEDASTVYVGENSVLVLHDLTTKAGVPRTKMELVSGMVTLHLEPTIAGESYQLDTPSTKMSVIYPTKAYVRVNSYLDGTTATPMEKASMVTNHRAVEATTKGQILTYRYGDTNASLTRAPDRFKGWDAWVAERVENREAAMSEVMSEAKLSTPLPGLEDMKEQGRFFPCEPYGTCWQPTEGWSAPSNPDGAPNVPGAAAGDDSTEIAGVGVAGGGGLAAGFNGLQVAQGGSMQVATKKKRFAGVGGVALDDDIFPCPVVGYRQAALDPFDYNWVVCHSGSWIYRDHRYAWVAGTRRHHHCPVHWVKSGKTVGYVPIHPRDVAGKTPVNLKHGMFTPGDGKGGAHFVARVEGEEGSHVRVLDQAPKEFRRGDVPSLPRTEAPVVAAHVVQDGLLGGRHLDPARPVSTIHFDHRSQGFTVATRYADGGKNNVVTERIGGHAEMPTRGGFAGNGGGGFHGGVNGGGGGAGGHSGSAGGGGGSFSHGGSSGGGGGSFGGGGGHAGGGGGGGGTSGGGGASHGK